MEPVQGVIARLGLVPHPEGGWYRETFRAAQVVQTPRGPRSASTAILFLLEAGGLSALHRTANDEVWHHYEGAPVRLFLAEEGRTILLGPGGVPQFVVPGGAWQAARCDGSGWALCGCTVAPGFDFADFEMPSRAEALALFPDATAWTSS